MDVTQQAAAGAEPKPGPAAERGQLKGEAEADSGSSRAKRGAAGAQQLLSSLPPFQAPAFPSPPPPEVRPPFPLARVPSSRGLARLLPPSLALSFGPSWHPPALPVPAVAALPLPPVPSPPLFFKPFPSVLSLGAGVPQ